MNKRALIGLAVVPFVLASVLLWARHRMWQKLETNLRQEILSDMKGDNPRQAVAEFDLLILTGQTETTNKLAKFNSKQVSDFMSDVKLQKSLSNDDDLNFKSVFVLYVNDRSYSSAVGLKLGLEKDEGSILECVSSRARGRVEWDKYQLTPESCRSLKKRIWNDFGPKLRELHIPPPR